MRARVRERLTGVGGEQIDDGALGGVLQGAAHRVEFGGVEAVSEGVERAGEVVDVVAVEGSQRQSVEVVQDGTQARESVLGCGLGAGSHVFQSSRTTPVSKG